MNCGACGSEGPAVGVFGNTRPEFEDVVGTPLCLTCYHRIADTVAHKIRMRRGDYRASRYDRMKRDDPFTEDPQEMFHRMVLDGLSGVEDP